MLPTLLDSTLIRQKRVKMKTKEETGKKEVMRTDNLMSAYRMGKVVELRLSHRVVMAAMTRCRALNGIPNEAMVEYYSQRATNGGLLISEGTFISPAAHGYPHCPGIYQEEQLQACKKITDSVHSQGAYIFCQLWHVGRASHLEYQPGSAAPISSTNKPISSRWKGILPDGSLSDYSNPRALHSSEIPEIVDHYHQAAINAIQAVVEAIGIERIGVKISPTMYTNDSHDSDPLSLGLAVVERLNKRQEEIGLELPYLQIQAGTLTHGIGETEVELLRELRRAYQGTFMISGGFNKELGMKAIAEDDADLVAYARFFLSNPDLVRRFEIDAPLNDYDAATFYTHDPVVGYSDYPSLDENSET
ncbi:hypothetical protein SOVF_197850 [Spinacia oleracea]|nr:hypothetical protein SOVF_197850 [Spinacia oleracea]